MQLISADEDCAELQRKIASLQTEISKLVQSRKDIQAAHERIHKDFQIKMTDLTDTNEILVEINKNLDAQNQDRQVSTDVICFMKPWNLPNITIYTTKVQWLLRFIVIGQLIEVKHEITVIRPLSSLIDFVTSFIKS